MKLTDKLLTNLIAEELAKAPTTIEEEKWGDKGGGEKLKSLKKVDTFQMDKMFSAFRIDEKTLGSKEESYDRAIMKRYIETLNLPSPSDPQQFIISRLTALTESALRDCTKGSAQSKITALGFLNSLKIVLSDFSSVGAGFIAESFLSTLFEAEQVPAGSAGIEDMLTINDVGDKRLGISLKSFSSEAAKVHGSIGQLFESLGIPFIMPSYEKKHWRAFKSTEVLPMQMIDGKYYTIYKPLQAEKNIIYLVGNISKDGNSVTYSVSPTLTEDLIVDALIQAGMIEPKIGNYVCAFKYTNKPYAPKSGYIQYATSRTSARLFGATRNNPVSPYEGWVELGKDKKGKPIVTKEPFKTTRQMKMTTQEFMEKLSGKNLKNIQLPLGGNDLNKIANDTMKELWASLKQYEDWFVGLVGNLLEYTTSFESDVKTRLDNVTMKEYTQLPKLTGADALGKCAPQEQSPKLEEENEKLTQETLDKLIERVILYRQ